jgi:hypothetical protein
LLLLLGVKLVEAPQQQPNIALVRTEQRLSVSFQGYPPPHNFTVER